MIKAFSKTVSMVILLLLLAFCFSGCSLPEHQMYQSLIETSNCPYSRASEFDCWSDTFCIKENMPDQSCLVLGTQYFGSYRKSKVKRHNSYTSDLYYNESIKFELRSDTGDLVSVDFQRDDFSLPNVENPYETAVSLATDVAGQLVDDLAEYTELVIDRLGSDDYPHYSVSFVKKVQGYLTNDYVRVIVNSKGNVTYIALGDRNAFDEVQLHLNETVIRKSILKKTKEAYQDSELTVSDIEINGQKLILTPDGTVFLRSELTVSGTDKTSGLEASTKIWIFTTVGKKTK